MQVDDGKYANHHENQVQTEFITSILRFLQDTTSNLEDDCLGCLEIPQPPLLGVILSFEPLTITDHTFQHSVRLIDFDCTTYKNTDLDISSFGIELIDWRWRLILNTGHRLADGTDIVQAACSSFRIWRDTGNLIEIDVMPPSLLDHDRVKQLAMDKITNWNVPELKVKKMTQNRYAEDFIGGQDLEGKIIRENIGDTDESSLSAHHKENLPIGRSIDDRQNRDQKMYLFKKSVILRGHPVLIKIKERSRSSSPSRTKFKESNEVISVISDNED